MNSTMPIDQPTDGLQKSATVAFWISASALVAVLLCAMEFFAVLGSDSGVGGPIALFGRAIGPYFGTVALVTLALELLAIALLAIGAVRWHFSIVRSPRWIASGVCTLLVAFAMVTLGLLYFLIATSHV
jgi:hypothetical protein